MELDSSWPESSFSDSSSPDSGIGADFTTCRVCGDLASGIHYDVASCNGCKTFFRRTVTSGRKFQCKSGGRCLFDKDHRCSCRACRFRQCVEKGMNPKCRSNEVTSGLTDENVKALDLIGNALHLEECTDRLRHSSFIDYECDVRLQVVLHKPSKMGMVNKFEIVERWPERPTRTLFPNEFKEKGIKFWFYNDIYLSIEFMKTFQFLRQLSDDDQMATILHTALPLANMSACYYAYKKNCDIIIYPDGWLPFQHRGPELLPLERIIRAGVVPHLQSLKPDQIQYSLMRVLALLSPGCASLSEDARLMISAESGRYSKALLHYLQNKHGMAEGIQQFSESISFLNNLYQRKQYNYNYYAYRYCILQLDPITELYHEVLTNRIQYRDCAGSAVQST